MEALQGKVRRMRLWVVAALMCVVALSGTVLSGCSSQEQAEKPAAEADVESKAAETEVHSYPRGVIWDNSGNCVITDYLNDKGIDVKIKGDMCEVEVPANTWDEVEAYAFEAASARVSEGSWIDQPNDSGEVQRTTIAPLSCEVGEDFSTVAICVDATSDDFGMSLNGYLCTQIALEAAGMYRTFVNLDPTTHLTVTDQAGSVVFDGDCSTEYEIFEPVIAPLFGMDGSE